MRIFASCRELAGAFRYASLLAPMDLRRLSWQIVRTAAPDFAGRTGANTPLRN